MHVAPVAHTSPFTKNLGNYGVDKEARRVSPLLHTHHNTRKRLHLKRLATPPPETNCYFHCQLPSIVVLTKGLRLPGGCAIKSTPKHEGMGIVYE